MKKLFVAMMVCFISVLVVSGCKDMGTEPTLSVQPPPVSTGISFQNNIKPIFQTYGCNGCHGGSGGLFVQTVPQLLKGGDHGPVVAAGKGDSSNIVKKLSPTPPFGDRMPQGGPYLPDSTRNLIRDWINQGAKDN